MLKRTIDIAIDFLNHSRSTAGLLGLGEQVLAAQITEPHDPPLIGMEQDRDERTESYVKDFQPLVLGDMALTAGRGTLSLHAQEIPGAEVMDVRLLVLRRIGA